MYRACVSFPCSLFPCTCRTMSFVQPGSLLYLLLFFREDETHLGLATLWALLAFTAALRCWDTMEPKSRGRRLALRMDAFCHTYLALGTVAASVGVRRVYAGWLSIWCVLFPPPLLRWILRDDWAQCAHSGLVVITSELRARTWPTFFATSAKLRCNAQHGACNTI